ncbi:MAG: LysR family transcriptional regulator [Clostridiales Family XIII bacterium]|jgi:DNA-binding transcriptional LysR family regulator|nr:LysR family transcriptional regulator [Clostridiales Family XIII bacterium]
MENITFPQINAFLTVAKYKNCSRAAKEMFVTQPTLSKTLKTFEDSIGIKLCLRNNMGITLTKEGEYLKFALEHIVGDLGNAFDYAKAMKRESGQTLRFVAPSAYDTDENFTQFINAIKLFQKKYPAVAVESFLCDFRELRETLDLGIVDFAITQDFVLHNMPNISLKKVSKMVRHIMISANHPLAASDEPDFDAFNDEVFIRIAHPDNDYAEQQLMVECGHYGFRPKRIDFVPNFLSFIHDILNRNGIGICGQLSNLDEAAGMKYYRLPEIDEGPSIVVAWLSDRLTPESKLFLDLLKER